MIGLLELVLAPAAIVFGAGLAWVFLLAWVAVRVAEWRQRRMHIDRVSRDHVSRFVQ